MEENPSMKIIYWGVRGSIPSPPNTEQIRAKEIALLQTIHKEGGIEKLFGTNPSNEAIKDYLEKLPLSISGTYGGNTTCVEIQARDSPLIMIDSGTGARELGYKLKERLFSETKNLNPLNSLGKFKRVIHLFLTHYHWDHIQGFPFFDPAFIPVDDSVYIHIYGKKDEKLRLSDILAGQQQYHYFPVVWKDMPFTKNYHELDMLSPRPIKIGKVRVTYQTLTHPGFVFAYAFEINGKKFVFATDNELTDTPDPRLVKRLTKLSRNADILYFDSQYDPEGYIGDPNSVTGELPKIGWGHSTYEWAVKHAIAANVATLVLGHHEPRRNDFEIEKILTRAIEFRDEQLNLPTNESKKLDIVLASEGLERRL